MVPPSDEKFMTEKDFSTDGYPSPGFAWLVVGVLTFCFMLAYVDRIILSVLVTDIKRDLEITDLQISFLQGLSFTVFYTFMGIPIASLADRRPRTIIIMFGMAMWSLATAACGLARSYWQLLGLRMFVGAGEGALQPAAFSMISDLFPPQRLGLAMSIYSLGAFLGAALAFLFSGGAIALAANLLDAAPELARHFSAWQAVFIAVGLPGVFLALLVGTLPEPNRRHNSGNARVGSLGRTPGKQLFLPWLRAHWKAYGAHAAGFAMLTLANQSLYAWTPALLQRVHQMSAAESGLKLGLVFLLSSPLGILAGGMLNDRWSAHGIGGAPLRVGLVSALGLLPFVVVAPLVTDADLLLLLYVPLGFFVSFSFGAAAAGVQVITPASGRARASALYVFVINLVGVGLGPTLTAFLTDKLFRSDAAVGQSLAIVCASACALAIAIFWAGFKPFATASAAASLAKGMEPRAIAAEAQGAGDGWN